VLAAPASLGGHLTPSTTCRCDAPDFVDTMCEKNPEFYCGNSKEQYIDFNPGGRRESVTARQQPAGQPEGLASLSSHAQGRGARPARRTRATTFGRTPSRSFGGRRHLIRTTSMRCSTKRCPGHGEPPFARRSPRTHTPVEFILRWDRDELEKACETLDQTFYSSAEKCIEIDYYSDSCSNLEDDASDSVEWIENCGVYITQVNEAGGKGLARHNCARMVSAGLRFRLRTLLHGERRGTILLGTSLSEEARRDNACARIPCVARSG
jgi:hypothetical protein